MTAREVTSRGTLGRRTASDGKKNQPRRVRRPTGAECRIQRARRLTGSDERKLFGCRRRGQMRPKANSRSSDNFHQRSTTALLAGWRGTAVRLRRLSRPMHDAFGPGGALAATLPGFEPRPEQAALAAAVERALATGEHLVAEAGTGTGKSLAYLIPALESGQRVVVATATKALQEQLLAHDVPAAARALGREVRVAVLKGRQNYLCRKQLQSFGPMLLRDPRDEEAFEALQPWLDRDRDGRPRRARRRAVRGALGRARRRLRPLRRPPLPVPLDVLRRGGASPRRRGRARDREPRALLRRSRRRRRRAARARRGRLRRGAPARGDGRDAGSAGGSRAPGCAGSPPTSSAPAARRPWRRPGARSTGSSAPATACCARSRRRRGRRRLREPPAEPSCCSSSTRSRSSPTSCTGTARSSTCSRAARSSVAAQVEACLEPDPLERVVWAEPDAVAWAPVDVSGELRERLWDEGPTAILVSATLTTGEDARFVRRRLGLDHARELVVGSPYDFREQALLYVPRTLPDPRAKASPSAPPTRSLALLALSEGRALVLTSSYRALDVLRERVRGRVPYEVLVQGEAPRERLLERFRDEVDSVLLATVDLLAGRRRPGRVALAARDRQAAVLGAGRPAARGALRGGRGRRRRLVPRLRAADGDAAAAAGLRPPDPRPRATAASSRSSTRACARGPTAARSSPRCRRARSSTTAPRSPPSSASSACSVVKLRRCRGRGSNPHAREGTRF